MNCLRMSRTFFQEEEVLSIAKSGEHVSYDEWLAIAMVGAIIFLLIFAKMFLLNPSVSPLEYTDRKVLPYLVYWNPISNKRPAVYDFILYICGA